MGDGVPFTAFTISMWPDATVGWILGAVFVRAARGGQSQLDHLYDPVPGSESDGGPACASSSLRR